VSAPLLRAVIASRIGGLPYTVTDGVTGMLFEPGDPDDLARKIARVLDDPDLRRRMGLAGRKRFEEDFIWDDVIERCFRPLLSGAPRLDAAAKAVASSRTPQLASDWCKVTSRPFPRGRRPGANPMEIRHVAIILSENHPY